MQQSRARIKKQTLSLIIQGLFFDLNYIKVKYITMFLSILYGNIIIVN